MNCVFEKKNQKKTNKLAWHFFSPKSRNQTYVSIPSSNAYRQHKSTCLVENYPFRFGLTSILKSWNQLAFSFQPGGMLASSAQFLSCPCGETSDTWDPRVFICIICSGIDLPTACFASVRKRWTFKNYFYSFDKMSIYSHNNVRFKSFWHEWCRILLTENESK